MSWFTTHSGTKVFCRVPRKEDIRIDDIAEALSKICRFNGHCAGFYSVAQHSVIAAQHAAPRLKFAALMHDAHEAYVQDVISPLKDCLGDNYRNIENKWEAAVRDRFGVNYTLEDWKEIKKIDLRMLATEHRDLFREGEEWPVIDGFEPFTEVIKPLDWVEARAAFVAGFDLLFEEFEET